jgi:hypothetical protein
VLRRDSELAVNWNMDVCQTWVALCCYLRRVDLLISSAELLALMFIITVLINIIISDTADRLCGLVVRVPGYTTEMYCASCEVRTEFIYVM